jgi:hypothetical protein
MHRHIDKGSSIVALITLGLFIAALFTKGLGHDLFLEAGVFPVSVKIIVMAYRNNLAIGHLDEKLDTILAVLAKKKENSANSQHGAEERSNPNK